MKGIIKNIEVLDNQIDYVYDITVQDNHNFFANDILVSNCHHIAADTFVNISKQAKNAYYRIGVSATPWREDGADLMIESALNKKKNDYAITASKLIDKGYLVPCDIYMIPIMEIYPNKRYDQLYKTAIVDNMKRNLIACKIALNMRKFNDSTILMLIQQVNHGYKILSMLGEALEKRGELTKIGEKDITDENDTVIMKVPIYEGKYIEAMDPMKGKPVLTKVSPIEFLSGSDNASRRAAVIEGVKQGIVKILIGSTIADEGLDIPNLDCLILLSAGKSSTKAFQRIGRVLRNSDGKKKAIVFDFLDNTPILYRHANARLKMYKTEPRWTIKKFDLNKVLK